MTQKDESPNASEGPYWSEELLAVLVVGLGDETQARETLEGIIQQALSGRALQAISEEALASYLSKLDERIAGCVQDSALCLAQVFRIAGPGQMDVQVPGLSLIHI